MTDRSQWQGAIRATGRSVWQRPLWMHIAVLVGLFVLVLPFTHPGGSLISDEGAAVLQARVLDRTGSWTIHAPLAQFDPADRADPLPYVEAGPKGRAPYAKHPLYPLLLLAASKVAGRTGYYLLSILGTVLAAAGAAALGRRLGASTRASLWLAGVATSLWFYALVLQAHSLGAAAAVAAVTVAWSAMERPRVLRLVGLFLLVVFTAAVRSEGVLFAGALAVAAVAVSFVAGRWRRAALAVAAVAVLAALAVRLAEHAFLVRVLGSGAGLNSVPSAHRGSLLDAPIRGFYYTWLSPTNQGTSRLGVALLLALALVATGALLVRQTGRDRAAVACLGGALACYVVWFVWGPAVPVEGLVIVFPAGWAALWSLTRGDVATPVRRFVAAVAVIFTVAVLLTQYPGGGGIEWGGRFFVLIVAAVAPMTVIVLARVHRDSFNTQATRTIVTVLGVIVTLVIAVGAVRAVRAAHVTSNKLLAGLGKAGREARMPFGPGGDPRPIVVTTQPLVPQLMWEGYDRFRWLDPQNQDLATYAERLAAGGARRLVLVPSEVDRDIAAIAPWYREVDRPRLGPHEFPPNPVIVFERAP